LCLLKVRDHRRMMREKSKYILKGSSRKKFSVSSKSVVTEWNKTAEEIIILPEGDKKKKTGMSTKIGERSLSG